MTSLVQTGFTTLPSGNLVGTIRLCAPRANALTPPLLRAIDMALDEAMEAKVDAILLCGERNFSTGGDVQAFLQAYDAGCARAYAQEIVSMLQDLVFRLLSLPIVVATSSRGAVTGGSCGFLFAADIAVGAPDMFMQAYYTKVGFAPDGGWTALLPDRLGVSAAQNLLQMDRRLSAQELHTLGLVAEVSDTPDATALERLDRDVLSARNTAKALLWDSARLGDVRARLDAETAAFVARIDAPDVVSGMRRFVQAIKASAHE